MLRLSASAQKPDAFISSTNPFRYSCALLRPFGQHAPQTVDGGLQSVHLWRSLARGHRDAWHPGQRQASWGVILAYAGMSLSLWIVGVLIWAAYALPKSLTEVKD